ncbi:hypothetical protein CPB83DRAFT_820499 [Crepidotus variabilis]|uniref:Uncharacterized protein n=1 Tax=Crepidotus variabilis TaxID=179855 RepID=A0A9P6JKE0_9AGAR|nr:hypothetical protein CPB83DRAFT_820499 [Crepidotus variabilis]
MFPRASCIGLGLLVLSSLGVFLVARKSGNLYPAIDRGHIYTYIGSDYPLEWPIPSLNTVHMSLENSLHYAFDTTQGRAEWNTTLPSGGALVYLGPHKRPFTLGMLHQIRCLGIIREILDDFYADDSPNAKVDRPHLARHCMNYIRQMVLCNGDLRLENVRAAKGKRLTVPEVTHTCKDWSAVYAAADDNFHELKLVHR